MFLRLCIIRRLINQSLPLESKILLLNMSPKVSLMMLLLGLLSVRILPQIRAIEKIATLPKTATYSTAYV